MATAPGSAGPAVYLAVIGPVGDPTSVSDKGVEAPSGNAVKSKMYQATGAGSPTG